jgi:hypothetical protein
VLDPQVLGLEWLAIFPGRPVHTGNHEEPSHANIIVSRRAERQYGRGAGYSRGRPKPNITCAMRRICTSSDPSVMR